MVWLIVAIFAYFILSIVYLVDKYLLKEGIPNPKVFVFYVGVLGISVLFLIPFVGFYIPSLRQIIISFLAGFFSIYALFWFYKTLRLFETSRAISAIGGLTPLFSFSLVCLFSFGKEILSFKEIIALVFLICGSVLITLERKKGVKSGFGGRFAFFGTRILKFCAFSAFLFSLSFVLSKYVYLSQSFWNGFIWMRIGGFFTAIAFFIFSPEVKKEIFKKKISFQKKTAGIFLSAQAAGGLGGILQNWAIALAPLSYVSVINGLQGVQYVFLFIFATFLSLKFPRILKEDISKKIIFQKIFAILSICLGLAILVLK